MYFLYYYWKKGYFFSLFSILNVEFYFNFNKKTKGRNLFKILSFSLLFFILFYFLIFFLLLFDSFLIFIVFNGIRIESEKRIIYIYLLLHMPIYIHIKMIIIIFYILSILLILLIFFLLILFLIF